MLKHMKVQVNYAFVSNACHCVKLRFASVKLELTEPCLRKSKYLVPNCRLTMVLVIKKLLLKGKRFPTSIVSAPVRTGRAIKRL